MNQADVQVPGGPDLGALPRSGGRRNEQALVGTVWALLIVNTLGTVGGEGILPLPRMVLQLVTMGALGAAFLTALVLNPRLRIRPNAPLFLLTLLLLVSVAASSGLDSGLGALFRCGRLTVFVATLWLLTPWFDGGLAFVRHHLRAVGAVLGSVVLGLALAPGLARPATFDSRLVGVVWPLTATQVADYATVAAGLTIVLWLGGSISGRRAAALALPALAILVLTHTRTATLGLVVALTVAGLSLATARVRARLLLGVAAAGAGLVAAAFAGPLMTWFQRGQDDESLADLTGRERAWALLLSAPRTAGERLLGVGLTDKSFAGRSIDNTWLAVFHEQGLVGVALVVLFLVGLIFAALVRPPSAAQACALFLVVYCMTASYTQVVLGDATAYTLHLMVAVALLAGGVRPVASMAAARRPT